MRGRAGAFVRGQVRQPLRRSIVCSLILGLALVAVVGADVGASSVITHGSRARPWVALTFDDGWSSARCAHIARTLRSKRATATFFINGTYMRRAPARWRAILDGFSVANHTFGHPWLTRLGTAAIRSQIATNEQVVERILGRSMLPLLRPPYGAYDSQVVRVADGLGYRTVLWDTSGVDTSLSATTSSVIRNSVRGGDGAIVLLHCGPSVTPRAVGPIIDSYRRRGYRLVDLGQMLGLGSPPRPPLSPTACRVHNVDKGITRSSLGAAVRAASPGDDLTVRGICRGSSLIGKSLLIKGIQTKTSAKPALVGKDDGPVVTVRNGVTVTIRDLTVKGGSAARGGGVVNRGALTLRDVEVRENRATVVGGGVFNADIAVLTLAGSSTIRDNRAPAGGGVANRGSVELRQSSSIKRNTATGDGGGVRNTGTLRMRGSSVIRINTASGDGGGVANTGALEGVRCSPLADPNVRNNTPDDCHPPPPPPED